jgi:hypothetical protein
MDGKSLSAMIRAKKKGALRPDMDSAGQGGVDPVAAWDAKQDAEVNAALGEPDHESASASMMGEGESTQDLGSRKKISARIKKYFEQM